MAEREERLVPQVKVGPGKKVDRGVVLGRRTGRKIASRKLTIGTDAVIRSGSIVYEGTTIGKELATGHNVVICEENVIGDRVWVWSGSVVTKNIPSGRVAYGNPARVFRRAPRRSR